MPYNVCMKWLKQKNKKKSDLGPLVVQRKQRAENRNCHSQNNGPGFVDKMKQMIRNSTKAFASSSTLSLRESPWNQSSTSAASARINQSNLLNEVVVINSDTSNDSFATGMNEKIWIGSQFMMSPTSQQRFAAYKYFDILNCYILLFLYFDIFILSYFDML